MRVLVLVVVAKQRQQRGAATSQQAEAGDGTFTPSPSCCVRHAGTGYFGIYDGHGGRNVADYLRLHLHNAVEKELRVKGDRSVEECLKAAFLITDMECSATGEQASGSTAVVCVVRRQGPKRCVGRWRTCAQDDALALLLPCGALAPSFPALLAMCFIMGGWVAVATIGRPG